LRKSGTREPIDETGIRRALILWYERVKRDLPWRRTRDPYAIWISEIMLQQTRVAAVIPYYEKFLAAFPDAAALAAAPEEKVLAMWAGLGYYSRARNLQKAARTMTGRFPADYESIRDLPGVGDYTAAAIASIAFGLPHAAVDGNVRRVIARLTGMDSEIQTRADRLLDCSDPGRWNQAVMELGATICTPRDPVCDVCPLGGACRALRDGSQHELPARREKPEPVHLTRTLLVIRRRGRIALAPGERVQGFWDLPEPFRTAKPGPVIARFRHTITHRHYVFEVREAAAESVPKTLRWFDARKLEEIALSTTARKALRLI
jgi:A/G-specific adenine glycosylase